MENHASCSSHKTILTKHSSQIMSFFYLRACVMKINIFCLFRNGKKMERRNIKLPEKRKPKTEYEGALT